MSTRATRLLRDRTASDGHGQRVTNIELFFDLVYVFAITQLSRHLAGNATLEGALQAALLLAMVWLCWAYTAWVTNWMVLAALTLVVVLAVAAHDRRAAGPPHPRTSPRPRPGPQDRRAARILPRVRVPEGGDKRWQNGRGGDTKPG